MSAYRPVITGTRHMIAAGHHAAAHAGFAILEAGGNAMMQRRGGYRVGVLQTDRVFRRRRADVIYLAKSVKVINIYGPALSGARHDRCLTRNGASAPREMRTVMPAAPYSWIPALGIRTLIFAKSRGDHRFARDGFAMHWFMAEYRRAS